MRSIWERLRSDFINVVVRVNIDETCETASVCPLCCTKVGGARGRKVCRVHLRAEGVPICLNEAYNPSG